MTNRVALYKQALDSVVPIRRQKRKRGQATAAKIVNVVATFALLPQTEDNKYKLPLDAISMRLGCSQYAPSIFAANIIKLRDCIATVTILLFDSGRGVIVSAQSLNHARYIGQLLRSILEQISCPTLEEVEEGGMLKRVKLHQMIQNQTQKGSLKGKTVFDNLTVHNIVANSDLGFRINLQAMCDAAPECCKWKPDLFPGLKCKIWLTEERQCMCNVGGGGGKSNMISSSSSSKEDDQIQVIIGKQNKCICAVKVLIFDTGMIVITGGRTLLAVNSVLQQIRSLTPTFESNGQPIPKEDRFYARLSTMMVPTTSTATSITNAVRVKQVQLKDAESMAIVLDTIDSMTMPVKVSTKPPTVASLSTRNLPPLTRMCVAGRLSDVRDMLEMDTSGVNDALEHMQTLGPHDRHEKYVDILALLQVYAL
jgi:TATA-box binding protein (TBP) (component of TFIID and TFIIIB)